jgi:hypothetical protein
MIVRILQTQLPPQPAPCTIFPLQWKAAARFQHLRQAIFHPLTLGFSHAGSLWFPKHQGRSASGLHTALPLDVPLHLSLTSERFQLTCDSPQSLSLTTWVQSALPSPAFLPLLCLAFFQSTYHILIY